jgi:hypothetical protein
MLGMISQGSVDLDAVMKLVAMVADPEATTARLNEIKTAVDEANAIRAEAEAKQTEAQRVEAQANDLMDLSRQQAVEIVEAANRHLIEAKRVAADVEKRAERVAAKEQELAERERNLPELNWLSQSIKEKTAELNILAARVDAARAALTV